MPPVRTILLTRHGQHFMLTFGFDADLNDRVQTMPFARWDSSARGWLVPLSTDAVAELRAMWHDGLLDVGPDDLLEPGEVLRDAPFAVVRPGTRSRPYVIQPARRDDASIAKVAGLPGARWNKAAHAYAVTSHALAELMEMRARGMLTDPENVLPGGTQVVFDSRSGIFVVHGDPRAQKAFDQFFPKVDVIATWRERGIDVAFANTFTEEVYAGELARVGPGLQPDGLALELYPFQAQNVAVAVARSGLLVCDMPGLGKTMTGVATAHEVMNNRKLVPRTIVVSPGGAVKSHWVAEIHRATGDDDIILVDGDPGRRHRAYEAMANGEGRWLVVNYDLLDRDMDALKGLAAGALIVADEQHRCKNPTTKRTKALGRLGRVAARRLGLTGTPVESVPDDWYWVLDWSTPGVLGSFTSFANRYMYPGRHGGYEGKRNGPELARRSRPHFMRHVKSEVATHLPPLRVQELSLDPGPKLATALRRLHAQAQAELADAARTKRQQWGNKLPQTALDEIEAAAEMTAMGMLRQVTTNPRLLLTSDSEAASTLVNQIGVPDVDGPKFDFVRNLAREYADGGERLVVFTFSRRAAEMLATRLTSDGIVNVTYTGSTTSAARDEAVRRFVDPGDPVTVFIATDAGAEGLNLGRHCSTLVNLDIPWTPTRMEQRANRIHRLDGTAPSYLVVNLTVRGTVEGHILQMVTRKAKLMDAIFAEDDARARTVGTGTMTVEDLLSAIDDCDTEPDGDAAGQPAGTATPGPPVTARTATDEHDQTLFDPKAA